MLIKQLNEQKCIFSNIDCTLEEIIENDIDINFIKYEICRDCGYCYDESIYKYLLRKFFDVKDELLK